MKKKTQEEVFSAIAGERAYQDSRWGGESHDSFKSVGDYLIYIDDYVRQAKAKYTTSSGVDETLDIIRKIAGLTVACMEYNGAPLRKLELSTVTKYGLNKDEIKKIATAMKAAIIDRVPLVAYEECLNELQKSLVFPLELKHIHNLHAKCFVTGINSAELVMGFFEKEVMQAKAILRFDPNMPMEVTRRVNRKV